MSGCWRLVSLCLSFSFSRSCICSYISVAIFIRVATLTHFICKIKGEEEEKERRTGRSRNSSTVLYLAHREREQELDSASLFLHTCKLNHQRELLHFNPVHNHSLNLRRVHWNHFVQDSYRKSQCEGWSEKCLDIWTIHKNPLFKVKWLDWCCSANVIEWEKEKQPRIVN